MSKMARQQNASRKRRQYESDHKAYEAWLKEKQTFVDDFKLKHPAFVEFHMTPGPTVVGEHIRITAVTPDAIKAVMSWLNDNRHKTALPPCIDRRFALHHKPMMDDMPEFQNRAEAPNLVSTSAIAYATRRAKCC